MRERWLSQRAVSLHVAALVAVPGCLVAAWWQISRAQDGNQLSYLYSVMWPVFAILTAWFWWTLIHTDYENAGLKGMRRRQALQAHAPHQGAGVATGSETVSGVTPVAPDAPVNDPELAAYNARLTELSSKGPKTWRNREAVVVRRAP